MKHLQHAYDAIAEVQGHIDLDLKNHSVKFTVQDGPINEVGHNGLQATDILEYVKNLFFSLNKAYPCQENRNTITHLNKALFQQKLRTSDREKRNVEGTSAI